MDKYGNLRYEDNRTLRLEQDTGITEHTIWAVEVGIREGGLYLCVAIQVLAGNQ